MIRQPECATVMEEKEREVIQLQRELMEAHATIGRLQAKLDGGEQEAEASCSGELVSAAPWSLVLHNVDDFAHQTQSLSNNEVRHVIDKRRLLNLHLRLADSEGNIVEPSSVQVGGFALEVTVHVAGDEEPLRADDPRIQWKSSAEKSGQERPRRLLAVKGPGHPTSFAMNPSAANVIQFKLLLLSLEASRAGRPGAIARRALSARRPHLLLETQAPHLLSSRPAPFSSPHPLLPLPSPLPLPNPHHRPHMHPPCLPLCAGGRQAAAAAHLASPPRAAPVGAPCVHSPFTCLSRAPASRQPARGSPAAVRALPHPAPAPPIVLAWPIMTPAVMEATTEVAAAAFAAASSAMAASDADDLQIQVDAAGEMAGGPDDFRHCVWADQVMLPSLTAAASAFDPVRAAVPAAAAGASNSPAKRRCPPASLVECGAGSSADLTDFSDADPPVARKATRAVSAMPPSPSEVRYEVSRLAVNMKDRRD